MVRSRVALSASLLLLLASGVPAGTAVEDEVAALRFELEKMRNLTSGLAADVKVLQGQVEDFVDAEWYHQLNRFFAKILGMDTTIWYKDYKLWVGGSVYIFIWGYDLLYVVPSLYWIRWATVLSVDLVCLHSVQFYGLMGLFIPLGMAVLQGILIIYETYQRQEHNERAVLQMQGFSAGNVYQDLNDVLSRSVTIFSVVGFAETKFEGEHSLVYWVCSIVAVQMAAMLGRRGDSALGRYWWAHLWTMLLNRNEELTYTCHGKKFTKTNAEIWFRCGMSFIVNAILRDFISFTTPLLMMDAGNPLDFVKDCLAVVYISTLDDHAEGVEYTFSLTDPTSRALSLSESEEEDE
eukprot:TRINITY_DN9379_c0_g1_i1.p1 TRINITY_DN9379_c0_g1~~TRINITY_DN9379_c0_g1_i1.p1  ORF type:complete len:350 (-),score=57.89 TRINITY_DN9379_c0_g1_i1:169-1218(-)